MNLESLLSGIEPAGEIPPVDRWAPSRAGELDLVITADGRWIHEGGVIARPRLVRLLASLLRRDADGSYWLVTPAEKQRIRVEDHPLRIVDAETDAAGDCWVTTDLGDRLRLDASHRLTVTATPRGEAVPEVPVRFGLAARLGRNVYYRLVERAELRERDDGGQELGVHSGGVWHPLGHLAPEAP